MLARLDNSALFAMRTRWHGPRREAVAKFLALLGEYGWIWLAIGAALAVIDGDRREEWLMVGVVGPFAIGLNFAIKLIVKRPRPVVDGYPPLGGAPSSLSFPSAHSTASFAAATAMTRVDPVAGILFGLAAAIAIGRPYLGMHYPSDVLAGAAFGTVLGLVWPIDLFA